MHNAKNLNTSCFFLQGIFTFEFRFFISYQFSQGLFSVKDFIFKGSLL